MLALARTLMRSPALLLLDEPSEGLALIAGQNMHFCLGVASHPTVIDKGQIVYTSGIEELKANENIRQRYLALKLSARSGRRHGHRTQAIADA
jgi:branched-chain amino acid transport system ATP-binding protein